MIVSIVDIIVDPTSIGTDSGDRIVEKIMMMNPNPKIPMKNRKINRKVE